jgi:hypothetical protein
MLCRITRESVWASPSCRRASMLLDELAQREDGA